MSKSLFFGKVRYYKSPNLTGFEFRLFGFMVNLLFFRSCPEKSSE